MMKKFQKSLMETAVQTFEDLGMMLLNEELTEDQKEAANEASMMVTFAGPFTGRLEISVYGEITEKLALNISGSEELASEIMPLDALGEIANVICGNVLPKIAGSKVIFDLTGPSPIGTEQSAKDAGMEIVADSHLGLEDGRAEIRLYVDNTAMKHLESIPQ